MFFVRLFWGSLWGTILIALIVGSKKVLHRHISPVFHGHIWLIFLLSLTVVFLPAPLLKHMETEEIQSIATESVFSFASEKVPEKMEIDDKKLKMSIEIPWKMLWGIGFSVSIFTYCMGRKKLRFLKRYAVPPTEETMFLFQDCCKKLSLKKEISLLQSKVIVSPFTFGLKNPTILLPEESLSKAEMEHILLHELTHIQHKDIWWNAVLCFLQGVYWFHPLFWWAFSAIREDRELYCDWAVLNGYEREKERLSYGETLLSFAGRKPIGYTVTGLLTNKKQLRHRIEAICDFQKETKRKKILRKGVLCFFLPLALLPLPALSVFAAEKEERYFPKKPLSITEIDLEKDFLGYQGTAVIYDNNADRYFVYEPDTAMKRFSPCSTYKIYSAIHALEEGIITPTENSRQWDGVKREFSEWNENQDLRSAMNHSVNWYFGELDKQAGKKTLRKFYKRIGYGNGLSENVSHFSGNGEGLQISPLEQVILFEKLYENTFQFAPSHVAAVLDAVCLSHEDGVSLYGKTGTGRKGDHFSSGWFVGCMDIGTNIYFFATYIEDEKNADGKMAADITKQILHCT